MLYRTGGFWYAAFLPLEGADAVARQPPLAEA